MKLICPLLSVRDMDVSKEFYRRVLGLEVEEDFGANVTLTGGLNLQTLPSWEAFIGRTAAPDTGSTELYFEEAAFDDFLSRLSAMADISYVHPAKEHSWGQRAVRLYDPDGHILEIGEPIAAVCQRFRRAGLTDGQIAVRMDVPLDYVKRAVAQPLSAL